MCNRAPEVSLVSLSQTGGSPICVFTSSSPQKLQRGVPDVPSLGNISVRVLKMWTGIRGPHSYVGKDSSLMRLLRRIGWYIVNDVSKDLALSYSGASSEYPLTVNPKDGGTTINRNAGCYWPFNMMLHSKKLKFSWPNVRTNKQLCKVEAVPRGRTLFLSFWFAVAP